MISEQSKRRRYRWTLRQEVLPGTMLPPRRCVFLFRPAVPFEVHRVEIASHLHWAEVPNNFVVPRHEPHAAIGNCLVQPATEFMINTRTTKEPGVAVLIGYADAPPSHRQGVIERFEDRDGGVWVLEEKPAPAVPELDPGHPLTPLRSAALSWVAKHEASGAPAMPVFMEAVAASPQMDPAVATMLTAQMHLLNVVCEWVKGGMRS